MILPGIFATAVLSGASQFQRWCGLTVLSCCLQQEMAVVKLGWPEPVQCKAVDFLLPTVSLWGPNHKAHLSSLWKLWFKDLPADDDFSTPSCIERVHMRAQTHTYTHTPALTKWPVTVSWSVRKLICSSCMRQALGLFLSGRIMKKQGSLWFMS